MMLRAMKEGWQIPDGMLEACPKIASKIALESKTEREKLRAIEVLAAMRRDNIAALQAIDKVERLDSGKATERVEFAPMKF